MASLTEKNDGEWEPVIPSIIFFFGGGNPNYGYICPPLRPRAARINAAVIRLLERSGLSQIKLCATSPETLSNLYTVSFFWAMHTHTDI